MPHSCLWSCADLLCCCLTSGLMPSWITPYQRYYGSHWRSSAFILWYINHTQLYRHSYLLLHVEKLLKPLVKCSSVSLIPSLPSGRNVSTAPRRSSWAGPWMPLSPSRSVTPSTCWERLARVTPTITSSPLWDTTWRVCPSTSRSARCWSTEPSSAAWSP